MTKQELLEAFNNGGYIYTMSDMNALEHIELIEEGLYASIWENWEDTQYIIDEFGDEDVAPTYTLDYITVKDDKADHGGMGQTFNSIEEAKAQFTK